MTFKELIESGVIVISLTVGALGSWYSFDTRLTVIENDYEKLPAVVDKLTKAVDQLNLTVAKLEVRLNYMEKEKGR